MQINALKPYLCALAAVICWGTTASVSKMVLSGMTPGLVLAYGCLFACGALKGMQILGHRKRSLFKKQAGFLSQAFLGLLGVWGYNYLLLCGMEILPGQQAFLINYFWPAAAMLFSVILWKEKLSVRAAVSLLFSVAGVLCTAGGSSGSSIGNIKGMIFCLLAALFYGLYSALLRNGSCDILDGLFIHYLVSAVMAFMVCAMQKQLRLPNKMEGIGLLYLGIICYALPYLLWAFAVREGKILIISNMAYLTPVFSFACTSWLLGESADKYQVGGFFLILLAQMIQIKKVKA